MTQGFLAILAARHVQTRSLTRRRQTNAERFSHLKHLVCFLFFVPPLSLSSSKLHNNVTCSSKRENSILYSNIYRIESLNQKDPIHRVSVMLLDWTQIPDVLFSSVLLPNLHRVLSNCVTIHTFIAIRDISETPCLFYRYAARLYASRSREHANHAPRLSLVRLLPKMSQAPSSKVSNNLLPQSRLANSTV